MPLQLTPGDRKVLLIAGGIFLIMVVSTVVFSRGPAAERESPTTYSTASGGARAAFLLLQESGYRTSTWEQPLRELPEGDGKVLIIAEPESFPALEDKQRLEMFIQTGGRVIAAGRYAAYGLPANESSPEPTPGTTWKHYPAIAPSPITRAAPEITLTRLSSWRLETGAVALYGEPEAPVVVEYKFGKGSVLWLGGTTPLTNAGLKESGNLEFLLVAVGNPSSNEVLWDEYVHGFHKTAPLGASTRVIGWIGLQFAVLVGAVLLAYSRRSGPIWVPQPDSRLSPLEFVRTLGELYENAHAGGVAVDIYYQRFRFQLIRRLGLAQNASVDDLDRAIRERFGFRDEGFRQTLVECEACRYDPNVSSSTALRLVQTLFDYAQRLKLTISPRKEKAAWKPS